MANRATVQDIRIIMDEIVLSDAIIEAYITSANVMVSNALGDGTTPVLKEIERWVTGHMIAVTRERQAKKEEAGGAKIEYTGTYGEFLRMTSYGQMALSLDISGKLSLTSFILRPATIYAIKSF